MITLHFTKRHLQQIIYKINELWNFSFLVIENKNQIKIEL